MHEGSESDLPLVTRPCDEIRYVGSYHWKKQLRRLEWSHIYVVAHRQPRHEQDEQIATWTHIYRIVADIRMGRSLVYLEAVLQGECMIRGLALAKELIRSAGETPWSDGHQRRSTNIGRAA